MDSEQVLAPEVRIILLKVDRSLEERRTLLYRLVVAQYIWLSFFQMPERQSALDEWKALANHHQVEYVPFTHKIVDILEGTEASFLFFTANKAKLMKIANYIAIGSPQREAKVPDRIKQLAMRRQEEVLREYI